MEAKYRPSYLTHYKGINTSLNIDDYTRLWGSKLMPQNMIYRPVSVTVALNPDVAYKLQVDATRQNWRKELCEGVRSMMDAPDHVEFSLRDDMGRDLKDIPVSRIFHVGRLYPHVTSKGTTRRTLTKGIKPGDNISVPINLSANKKAHFDEWVESVQNEVIQAVSASLGECATAKQVGHRLMLDDRNSIKKPIQKAMRKGFQEVMDVHCSVRDVDSRHLINKMSEFVMSAIKDSVLKNKTKVHDWFHADRHEKTTASSSIGQEVNELEIDDSISANATKLKREYPQSKLLFGSLVASSLSKNDIGRHMYYLVLRGGKKHHRRRHHHHKKAVAHNGNQKVLIVKGRDRVYHKHPGREYRMHDSDKQTYMRTLFKSHDMQGLHKYPGTLPYGEKITDKHEVSAVEVGTVEMKGGNPYGLASGAPSLESVGSSIEPVVVEQDEGCPSIESVYPDSRNFGKAPSIEPVYVEASSFGSRNPHGLESERSANPHGLESVEAPLDNGDSLEAIEDDMPPALESVGSEVDDEMDSMELLEEVEQAPPLIKSRGKKKKKSKPVETNIFDDVVSVSSSSSNYGGLPSLSSFKKQYGLLSEEPKEISSGVHGKSYSKNEDDPVYGNAMKIMGHYYVMRHGHLMKVHKNHKGRHGRKKRRRRVIVMASNKKVFSKMLTQEITDIQDPVEIEQYIEGYIASSYQENGGTVSFTTADGRTHRILPNGTYYMNGRKQLLPVEKLVKQELSGEPVLLVLQQNKV